ncbi:hypothetical protein NAPIS_ORF01674 [Vairimorpha apis BRL 01]|uniref:Uncharacterized protein n=1 Tax=Vairimorpha apis BRL 01 TaxID=1037528 RepID=T0L8D7_9MICR|nr:hypothetical protein NAPIS_ORF01674 [Vairimorpha apis BRL 01]
MIILYAILFILIFLISFYNLLYLYEPTIKFEVTDKFQTIKDYSSTLNNILPYDDEETNDFDNICDKILSELDIENVFYKNFYNLKRDILNEVELIAYFDNISFGIRLHDSLENFDELYKEKKVEIENRIKLVFAKFYLQKKYIEIEVYKKLQGEELNENNEDIKGVSKLVLKEDEKSINDERIFKEEINLISNEIDILATYIESYNSKYDEKNLKEEDKYVDDEKNKITEEKEILATFIEAFNSIFIEENSIDQDNYDKYVEYKNSKITKEKDIVSNEKSCKLVNDGKNKITKEKKLCL